MFLLDAGNSDFQATAEPIRKVLARSEAEILALKPWDERKLAYEIARRKRGLYALTYFKVDPVRISEIEHDCQLNEQILRVLILRRETLSEEEINSETPAMASDRRAADRKAVKDAEAAGAAEPEAEKATADEEEPDEKEGEKEIDDERAAEPDDDTLEPAGDDEPESQ